MPVTIDGGGACPGRTLGLVFLRTEEARVQIPSPPLREIPYEIWDFCVQDSSPIPLFRVTVRLSFVPEPFECSYGAPSRPRRNRTPCQGEKTRRP